MLFSTITYLGIDPTAGQRPFIYAALDHDLRPIAIGHGKIDEVLAFAAGQRQAVCAVCAPRQPNQGVMRRAEIRHEFSLPSSPRVWKDFRLADYLLRKRGISIPQTPASLDDCPGWMQMGFKIHERLQAIGYATFPSSDSTLQVMEVYPFASFAVMLGLLPFPKYSLEGRLQRQLALFERKVRLPDAMLYFEEITRHRLLNGKLPSENLFNPGELDALAAAYTAWLSVIHPDQVTVLGDPDEGQVVLPSGELKAHYSYPNN